MNVWLSLDFFSHPVMFYTIGDAAVAQKLLSTQTEILIHVLTSLNTHNTHLSKEIVCHES